MAIQGGLHATSSSVHSRGTCSFAIVIIIVALVSGSLGQSAAERFPKQLKSHRLSYSPVVDVLGETHQSSNSSIELQRFLEISRPVIAAKEKPVESIQLLYHEFADTEGLPPATAQYVPTRKVVGHRKWDKVVLKWSAVCRGRQFDRIAAVWLGGVEILRTCTAEPTLQGIIWDVEKDVTRYSSLWRKPQQVVVSLGNVVDSTYTGIINVTVSVEFYRVPAEQEEEDDDEELLSQRSSNLDHYAGEPADVILPIIESNYLDGGYWFQLSSEDEKLNASLQIPHNTYRAVLEVCLSPHGSDEFWYSNPPNAYLEANNVTGVPGNGSFREVVVSIDDRVVAVVYPFVVVYTGGVNPLFWRPVAAIGAFDLPSYDFDVTPFVGYLLDGKSHSFSLTVTDALYVWLLDANLHLWLDPKRHFTTGSLIEYSVPASNATLESNFHGLDGVFKTTASRTLSYVGHVASSFGNLTTSSSYTMKFSNTLVFADDSNLSTVDQLTESEGTVVVTTSTKEVALERAVSSFPFYLYAWEVVNPDNSAVVNASIVHSLKTDLQSLKSKGTSFSSLSNGQSSTGQLFISVNNTISGIGATNQTLSYEGTDGCFQRTVIARNYTVTSDTSTVFCSHAY